MCSEACAKTVRETLLSVDGVMSIEPQLEYNAIFVYGFADAASMISALTEIGYPCTEGSYHGMTRKDMKSALASMKQGKNSTHPSKSKASSRKSSGTAFDQPVQSFQSSGSSAGTHFAEFRVSGMSCAACVRAVEGGVIKQAGVVSVRVALLAEKAEVIYNGFRVQGMEIADAITTLGYTAKLITERKVSEVTKREYKFTVDGRALMDHTMNGRIEDTIQALGGICSVQIDGMAHAVNVVVDDKLDGSAGPRDIIEAIEGLGCAASLADDANALNGDGEDGSAEVNSWGRLLCISMMLGIPVMVLHMTMKHSKALMMAIDQPAICDGAVSTMQIVMLLLNLPLQFGVGYRFYRAAFLGALHGNFGMDALVVTGTTITFVYSVVSLLMSCATGMPSKHVFFEASGMLLMFVTMGKFFEAYAKGRSVNAITNLLKLQPTQALLVEKTAALSSSDSAATTTVTNAESVPTGNRFYGSMTDDSKPMSPSKDTDALYVTSPSSSSHGGGGSSTSPFGAQESVRPIALALVQRGDIVKVLPGARLPTDGIILSGSSYVDESMITGESVPQMRRKDDLVFGSTVNQNGCLYVQVKSVGADSALAQIVKLVENAQMEKAPVQAYADKIAAVFTPIVLTLAFLTFSAWACAAYMHAIPEGWYTEEYGDPVLFSMLFGISVVVISCPCALGLATPTAIMVGTSVGANNGVLIKGGPAFEMAHKIDTVILDKTGTLTEGKPSLIDEVVFDESLKVVQDSIDPVESEALCEQKDRILQLAASVEQGSEHPLAQAVMQVRSCACACACFIYIVLGMIESTRYDIQYRCINARMQTLIHE
jgi:Cu+-exporting ATPase